MRCTIVLKNIEFQACHGATAAERRSLRRFQLDVRLSADLGRSMASDRLQDTIDYQALSELVVQVATQRTYRLLESLCGALLDAIGERWPQADVELELRKLHPPCQGNPDHAAVLASRPARLPTK
ncbi:MAG: dihydroneopterin aldolase [Myxococcales bacterium]|nr:dihydroneopterin aldolase [Myxococcota bacterium]MDW8283314.1 dihydroneopterin aldolase [Myxococcales bacterium]